MKRRFSYSIRFAIPHQPNRGKLVVCIRREEKGWEGEEREGEGREAPTSHQKVMTNIKKTLKTLNYKTKQGHRQGHYQGKCGGKGRF